MADEQINKGITPMTNVGKEATTPKRGITHPGLRPTYPENKRTQIVVTPDESQPSKEAKKTNVSPDSSESIPIAVNVIKPTPPEVPTPPVESPLPQIETKLEAPEEKPVANVPVSSDESPPQKVEPEQVTDNSSKEVPAEPIDLVASSDNEKPKIENFSSTSVPEFMKEPEPPKPKKEHTFFHTVSWAVAIIVYTALIFYVSIDAGIVRSDIDLPLHIIDNQKP